MPIEINLIWKLADPAYAIPFGLMLILVIATLVYQLLIHKQLDRQEAFTRKIAFTAEILVSIGIIGLITFAARAKIDSDIREAEATAMELRRQVNVEFWNFAKTHCLQANKQLPAIDMEAIGSACDLWPQIITSPGVEVPWWQIRETITQLTERPNVTEEFRAALTTVADLIDKFSDAQNNVKRSEHIRKLVESGISWPLIAISMLLAAVGVALKWVRAAVELKKNSLRRHLPTSEASAADPEVSSATQSQATDPTHKSKTDDHSDTYVCCHTAPSAHIAEPLASKPL